MKINGCCKQAIKDRYDYVWIDTCCIDKSSSAELSEAINSMFRWYRNSEVCYIHLADVENLRAGSSSFRNSRWFTRGWTLQELIAQRRRKWMNSSWFTFNWQGDNPLLSRITGIPLGLLNGRTSISQYSAAQRMSWASSRQTTRIEDRAYSLLGIFNVNMPLLYGEGDRAFIRLQKEILNQYNDMTTLCWGYGLPVRDLVKSGNESGALGSSPEAFAACKNVTSDSSPWVPLFTKLLPWSKPNQVTTHLVMTGRGILIEVALRYIDKSNNVAIAMINAGEGGMQQQLGIILISSQRSSNSWKRLSVAPVLIKLQNWQRWKRRHIYIQSNSDFKSPDAPPRLTIKVVGSIHGLWEFDGIYPPGAWIEPQRDESGIYQGFRLETVTRSVRQYLIVLSSPPHQILIWLKDAPPKWSPSHLPYVETRVAFLKNDGNCKTVFEYVFSKYKGKIDFDQNLKKYKWTTLKRELIGFKKRMEESWVGISIEEGGRWERATDINVTVEFFRSEESVQALQLVE